MLKDELERVIKEVDLSTDYIYGDEQVFIGQKNVEILAQAIVDRLEIDKGKLEEVLVGALYQEHIRTAYWTVESIAKTIAKAKPIKLKEK